MQRASDHSGVGLPRQPSRAGIAYRRISYPAIWAGFALCCLAALSFYRAHLVDAAYAQYAGCPHCLDLSVWANDAVLLSGFAAVFALSRLTHRRIIRLLLAGLALAGVVAYAADIVVFRLLTHRLLVVDVLHFASDAPLLTTVVRPLLSHPGGWAVLAVMVAVILAATLAIATGPASRGLALRWSVVAAAMNAIAWQVPQAQYIHQIAFMNLWQVNREVDPTRAYSEAFWRHTRSQPGHPLSCERGVDQEMSVIVVAVESLSAYHSKLFSGLNDDTPNLDRLAKEGTWFSHFYANGFSTEGGLISLLTGYVPIPTAGRFGSTMAFTEVDGDFHRWLKTEGYHTAFFTSGQLSIGRRDEWLRSIGIEYAEGAEHAFYQGMPRASFGAADDAALVDRFLQWHANERGKGPFMATVLTVATHPPFVSAATGRMDEAAAFREIDRQLGRLASTLKARGFFDKGLMLIVGDHRAMTPIPVAEQERFGASASARVPAIALGKTGLPPGEWRANMQQTDLIPSLRYLIDDHACRSDWQGRLFGAEPRAARYVVHTDPIRRNQVVFIEGNSEYRLLLDGDDTRWDTAPPRLQEADRLRDQVNRERMSRMVEFRAER
ncbi:MAG: LTA synthase family protein [Usitatibacter sp.]